MIESLALMIAGGIKKVVPDHPSSLDVLRYSISIILNAVFIIILTIIISLVTGKVSEASLALLSFAILRQFSGGVHLKSGMHCVILSTALMTAMTFFEPNRSLVIIFNIISLLLVIVFSPSRMDSQSKISKVMYPFLKFMSIIIVSSNFILLSPVISVSFLSQSISLINLRR